MTKTTSGYIDSFDTVSARLNQASGVVAALKVQYLEQNADEMQHILSAGMTLEVLGAVDTLLDQAIEAARRLDGAWKVQDGHA